MLRISNIWLVYLLFIITMNAQATDIFGNLKSEATHQMHLAVEDDYITHHQVIVASTEIDEEGNFHFPFNPKDSISCVYLKTYKHIYRLHVHSTGKYEIKLEATADAGLIDNKKILTLKSLTESKPKINKEIAYIDSLFDAFVAKNYLLMIHPRSIKVAADSFKVSLKEQVKHFNAYSRSYAQYTLAGIDEASGYRESYFFKNYTSLSQQINKHAYYNYINTHYKNYFELLIAKTCFGDGKRMINEQHNVPDMLSKMHHCDSLLSIDSLREYLLIAGLSRVYYKREFNKSSIEMMMRHIAFHSTSETNKKAATNFIHLIERLNIGSKAPQFELPNQKLDTIQLSQYKGMITYVCFTKFDNFDWQTHLSILERLQLLYEKRMHIITITLEDDMKQMNALWQQHKFSETILNGFDNLALRDAYGIDTLPKYILLDADGDVIKNSQCSPVDGIEEIIKQCLKK